MEELPGRRAFFRKITPYVSPEEMTIVRRSYRASKYAHREGMRDSGERFFNHPKRVALILLDELDIRDAVLVAAALLHDVQEDSFLFDTWRDFEEYFGRDVGCFVRTLTKPKRPRDKTAYLRRIHRANKDTRVLKLADRLDNLRHMRGWSLQRKRKYLDETKEWYLPLAHRTHSYLADQLEQICCEVEQTLFSSRKRRPRKAGLFHFPPVFAGRSPLRRAKARKGVEFHER